MHVHVHALSILEIKCLQAIEIELIYYDYHKVHVHTIPLDNLVK